MNPSLRFPAEWEAQSGVLIAWPHAGTDWAERLAGVEDTYIALVAAITRFQPVLVCVADDDVQAYARARLASARIDMDRVRFIEVAYDDPADSEAQRVLEKAFPDREIVQVPCRSLIWQNGSLHCITMQLPEGLV